MYKFKVMVGDWSDDGHGHHEDFILETNLTITEIRECHFRMVEYFPEFETMCSEFEMATLFDEEKEALKNKFPEVYDNWEDAINNGPTPYEFLAIWADCVMQTKGNEHLTLLDILEDEDIPSLHFYGYDEKKRHIPFFGYGLFSAW